MASLHAASSEDGWIHGLCKTILEASSVWYVKHLVFPLVISFPPAIILFFVSRESAKSSLPKGAQDLANDHMIPIVICVALYPVVMKALGELVRYNAQPRRAVSTKDLVALSSVLEEAASIKLTNALRAIKENVGAKKKSDVVLSHLLKPQEQYERLVAATYDFFSTIDTRSSYRVGLMRIDSSGAPVEWQAYSPPGRVPRMSPEALGAPASCISRCVSAKTIIVVGDVIKEAEKKRKDKRRFIAGVAGKEAGSQICMPVLNKDSGAVEMVLCVAAGGAHALDEGAHRVYEQLLAPIISRLQYERCLEVLSSEKSRDTKVAA
ncbi:hypothetical protein [Stenotrophomonas sp. Iso1]|uniref:hypothetical protein n=1 Tax=Stenotrophomonas sp. Iso1 TaxID=2977283 RepID=UPI0022B7BF94|nr:hypothetical protein [Stenotrophomonas sp. Iso1]